MFRIGEAVVLPESVDLRFTDRRDLTLVSVESRETFRCRSVTTNGSERVDQGLRLRFFCCVANIVLRNAEAFGEVQPQLRVIRRAGFFID